MGLWGYYTTLNRLQNMVVLLTSAPSLSGVFLIIINMMVFLVLTVEIRVNIYVQMMLIHITLPVYQCLIVICLKNSSLLFQKGNLTVVDIPLLVACNLSNGLPNIARHY